MRRRQGFTLLELLVVIGIITVLIAILLPALNRVRQSAMVLATPVAYIGTDSRLHLTDPAGHMDLSPMKLSPVPNNCPVCHSPPMWSPSGQFLAIQTGQNNTIMTAILNPMSGQVTTYSDDQRAFIFWEDSERFLLGDQNNMYMRNASTGTLDQLDHNPAHIVFAAPTPACAPAPFIASIVRAPENAVNSIVFLTKDFQLGRRVWDEPFNINSVQESPRVDPLGEYVGWTHKRLSGGDWTVAFKPVNAPTYQRPWEVGGEYREAYFCDWTEQETILANVTRDGQNWQLVIFGRDGRLLQQLATPVPPAPGGVASWRKYNHR